MGGSIGQALGTKDLSEGKLTSQGIGAVGGTLLAPGIGPLGTALGGMAGKAIGGANGQGEGPGRDFGPPPTMPGFESEVDPTTGLLKSQYVLGSAENRIPDAAGMEAFKQKALQQGPSSWANQAVAKQGLEEKSARQNLSEQGAAQNAMARSNLAMRGGLSGGAAERLAMGQERAGMAGAQNIGAQGALARANIGLQDEQTKNQFLQALPGAENARAGVGFQQNEQNRFNQMYNTEQAMKEKQNQRNYDLGKYQEQMKGYAANQAGEAMRGAGGGGKK